MGFVIEGVLRGIKDAPVFAPLGKALADGANFRLQHHQHPQIHVGMRDALGIDAPGIGFEFGVPRARRHEHHQGTEHAMLWGELGQLEQVAPQIGLRTWRGRHSAQTTRGRSAHRKPMTVRKIRAA
jgi:hypothetical protein